MILTDKVDTARNEDNVDIEGQGWYRQTGRQGWYRQTKVGIDRLGWYWQTRLILTDKVNINRQGWYYSTQGWY